MILLIHLILNSEEIEEKECADTLMEMGKIVCVEKKKEKKMMIMN